MPAARLFSVRGLHIRQELVVIRIDFSGFKYVIKRNVISKLLTMRGHPAVAKSSFTKLRISISAWGIGVAPATMVFPPLAVVHHANAMQMHPIAAIFFITMPCTI